MFRNGQSLLDCNRQHQKALWATSKHYLSSNPPVCALLSCRFDDPHNSTGAIGSRLENDAAAVKGVVGDQLALLTQNGITLIIGFVIAFLASWKLTLVVLSVMPLLIVSGYCQVRRLHSPCFREHLP